MHPIRLLVGVAAACLAAASTSPAASQAGAPPTISARSFTGGSAAVTVTGTVEFTQDVPLNAQASFGDGEKTWIQFGASGAETPNALLTYGDGEVGVSVGRGRFVATAGIMVGDTPQCSGSAEVTAALVSGHYSCPGIVSYDAKTGKMGKVNIDVRFTAKS
jgi:hypothetical protein